MEPDLPGLRANHPVKEILTQRDILGGFLKFRMNEAAIHSTVSKPNGNVKATSVYVLSVMDKNCSMSTFSAC